MKNIIIIAASVLLLVATAGFNQTQSIYISNNDQVRLAPRVLNYQGYLTDTQGNPITNPAISMTFAIFDAVSAGNQKWSETQSSVSIDKGIFNVLLGSVTPVPDSVFTASTNRWLQLTIAGQTLSPRTRITAVGYAYTSTYSDTAQYARSLSVHNHLGETWTTTAIDRALLMKIDRNTSSNINGLVDSVLNAGTGAAYGGYFSGGGTGNGTKLGIYSEAIGPSSSSNAASGLYGYSYHTGAGSANGVYGYGYNNGTGTAYGGQFWASGSSTNSKFGVYGSAIAPSGSNNPNYGVYGYSNHAGSGDSYGSYAYGVHTGSGYNYGTYGYSGQNGTGICYGGYFSGVGTSLGTKYGVHADAGVPAGSSNPGYGVYGESNNAGSGNSFGGYFYGGGSGYGAKYGIYTNAIAPSGSSVSSYGVNAYSGNAGSGVSYGGYFSGGGSGYGEKYGIVANASAPAGASAYSFGVNAYSSHAGSGASYGAYTYSTHTGTGANYGIYGLSNQNGTGMSYGGYFTGRGAGDGQKYGIYAEAVGQVSCNRMVAGVVGMGDNAGTDETFGGYFAAYGSGTDYKYGIWSEVAGATAFGYPMYAVYGQSSQDGNGPSYGGYFVAGGSHTGIGGYCGVHGEASDSGTGVYGEVIGGGGYAVFAWGNFLASGTKSAAVNIAEEDWRLLYCQESPEIWFEDFGEGQLHNGRTHIELEPIFFKTVTISKEHQMKVFVQLTSGDPMELVVKKSLTGFDVVAKDQTSNATFDYRIVAKRRGYEDLRLKKMEPGFRPDERRAENEEMRRRQEKKHLKMGS